MNRVSMMLACAAMLFAVQPALASDDVSSELAEMRELVEGLKQKVDAQEEQLDHQGQLLEQAQEVVREQQDDGTRSGLSTFLDSINVSFLMAGSYFYDVDDPDGEHGGAGLNNGGFENGDSLGTMPFHPDNDSFTVDQILLDISKEATEESRGGFRFGLLFGNTANFLGQGTGLEIDSLSVDNGRLSDLGLSEDEPLGRRYTAVDSTSDFYIPFAYIEYLCDCMGPEINFQFGKFQTLVGAEVFQADQNFNITRGNVYAFTQPVDELGLRATVPVGEMMEVTLGIVNDAGSLISSPDLNKEPSYEASVLVGDDKMNLRGSFLYGANVFSSVDDWFGLSNPNGVRSGLADVTGWFNPTDNLSTWVNYTYTYVEGTGASVQGVAVAGRAQVTDKIGAALRGEYVNFNSPSDGDIQDEISLSDSGELYSATFTLDYALTDHLTAKGEYRFDVLSARTSGQGFFENSDGNSDNRSVFGAELVYSH